MRWGILGCGSIATSAIIPAIRWAGGCDLVAIASRSLERAKAKCAEVGAPRAYGSYAELVADHDIDAIYIGLPNGEHTRWAIAAAEAGKHVLCDKSLALDAASALAARKAFDARGLRLVEGFMYRHHPQWTFVRSLLDGGAIGPVRHVRAVFRATLDDPNDHRWSKTLGGGALFDVTCYAINAARLVTREEPVRARAFARFASSGVDESTDALLQFPSGAVASVHGSLRAPFEQGVVIAGERGRILVERPFVPHWDPVEVVVEADGAKKAHPIGGANHFLHMIEHATRCFRDRGALLFPAEDGAANVAACAMVLDAARAV
ncbi:MAG: Gfo/Idh/MocA family oxidoreductase [Deltaproteobacteria bacterium]|nr:Gfo/Idh/MocA family oxidoreductase [Deltaproteobacteria bacterium]